MTTIMIPTQPVNEQLLEACKHALKLSQARLKSLQNEGWGVGSAPVQAEITNIQIFSESIEKAEEEIL